MKKFLGTVAGLAALCGVAFAQEYKATSLQTPVGKISFGAWGRSTFEIGQEKQDSQVKAKTTAMGKQAQATAGGAILDYENDKDSNAGYVSLAADGSNIADYFTAVAAYEANKEAQRAVLAGEVLAENAAAYGEQVGKKLGDALMGNVLIDTLKVLQSDSDDTNNFIRLNPDWSYGCRVGFWIIGRTDDEHFGFDFNLDSDARALFVHKLYNADEDEKDVNYNESGKYAVAIGDQAKIWGLFDANPIKTQFKVAFGKMRENVLRGSIGDFGQRESSEVKSEDDIFSEFWPNTGLFVSATGMKDTCLEGLYVAGAVDVAGKLGLSNGDKDRNAADEASLEDIIHMGQYGIGYTIPGLMQLKAQYWGDSISETNYKYSSNKYAAARAAGFDGDDYFGRMEFGVDFLGLMGGASSIAEVDLDKTPNAALIELGVKVPIVADNDLRAYDPEKFYNFYSCLGFMGVIQKGFIFYKGHLWGGQGVSNLGAYTSIDGSGNGLLTMNKGDDANIIMAGGDFLAEVCANPFGAQNVFIGLSGNYNITSATADGSCIAMGNPLEVKDLALAQHKVGAEIYVKKTFGSNNYIFGGIAYRGTFATMDGEVNGLVDLSYEANTHTVYAPIGIEMFF